MRCYICDRALDEPRFNKDHQEYDPCDPCLTVIADTVGSYEDRPYVQEDELGLFQAFFTAQAASLPEEDDEFA